MKITKKQITEQTGKLYTIDNRELGLYESLKVDYIPNIIYRLLGMKKTIYIDFTSETEAYGYEL